jgi:hypothetical protein
LRFLEVSGRWLVVGVDVAAQPSTRGSSTITNFQKEQPTWKKRRSLL